VRFGGPGYHGHATSAAGLRDVWCNHVRRWEGSLYLSRLGGRSEAENLEDTGVDLVIPHELPQARSDSQVERINA
jgi:hypothetical protein